MEEDLFTRFFTIVVIPQKTSKVSKFKISVPMLLSGIILLGLIVAGWSLVMVDYFSIRSKLVTLESANRKYEEQKQKLEEYRSRSKFLEYHLNRLNELNYKLRVLTSLEVERKSIYTPDDPEMGGYDKEKSELTQLEEKANQKGILEVIDTTVSDVENNDDEKKNYFKNLALFFESKKSMISHIPSQWPVKGFLTSGFGLRSDPFTGQLKLHHGIDISTKLNSPIYAPADGIVVFAGDDEVLGNLLRLDHGYGISTKFGHNDYVTVTVGQRVKRGDIIARVGSTGRSTGPHLHYEVIFNGIPQNPIKFISDSSVIPSYLE